MSAQNTPPEPQSPADLPMTSRPPSSIPLDSSLRIYHKKGLPGLSSTYPHGLISGHPRSATQQAALDARKEEILRTMTKEEMERAYEEKIKEVKILLEANNGKTQDVEAEMDKKRMEWDMEKRIWGNKLKLSGGV